VIDRDENHGIRLDQLLQELDLESLDHIQSKGFDLYLSLLLRWNGRVNLTTIRDEEGILRRHFVESIFCARSLPLGLHRCWISGRARASPESLSYFADRRSP
jgi:16S rRNA G527 N7-methylase RsmG